MVISHSFLYVYQAGYVGVQWESLVNRPPMDRRHAGADVRDPQPEGLLGSS